MELYLKEQKLSVTNLLFELSLLELGRIALHKLRVQMSAHPFQGVEELQLDFCFCG